MNKIDEHSTLLVRDGGESGARASRWVRARRAVAILGGTAVAIVGAVTLSTTTTTGVRRMLAARMGEWRALRGILLAPSPTARAGEKSPTTFTVYTHCKSADVSAAGGDFWLSPIESASIVRHNYDTKSFFKEDEGIPMTRTAVGDGVYAYTVTTNEVDFEWGFQLKNKNGEYWKEIGTTEDNSPLAKAPCVQKYGGYFNRVLTLEENPSTVSYVLGSCETACPSSYRDKAYCRQPLTAVVGSSEGTAVDLGTVDDARLVNFDSALMYGSPSVIDPSGRAETFRYNEGSATEQIWVVAMSDYSREYVKMVQVKVVVDPVSHKGKAFVTGSRQYTFRSNAGYAYDHWTKPWSNRDGCKQGYCNVDRYDIPQFWDQGVEVSGLSIQRMEFVKLPLGDAPPTPYSEVYDGDFLTSKKQILSPGEWGEDLDVRRVILKNGILCGGSINYSNCLFGKAFALDPKQVSDYGGPTRTSKQWLVIVVEHVYFKMVRVEISLNANNGVDARVIDAGYVEHPRTSDVLTSDSLAIDGSANWSRRSSIAVAGNFNVDGYGLGSMKFEVATEMVASLRDDDAC